MATSSTYTETRTATQLITDAHFEIGIVDAEEAIDSDHLEFGIRFLNDLIYQLKGPASGYAKSIKMWQLETASLTLVANQYSYSLKPSGGDLAIQIPEEIVAANMQVTSTTSDTPMNPMTLDEYEAITDKTETGTATRFYYERKTSEGTFKINKAPTSAIASANTIQLKYRQPIEIVSAGTNELDFPNHWWRAIKFQLALDLGCGYSIDEKTWQRVFFLTKQSMALTNIFDTEFINIYDMPVRNIE